MSRWTMLILLAAGAVYYLLNAAAGAMLPPEPGQERTRYGYWYRFVQRLAANSEQIAGTKLLPAIARSLAAQDSHTHQVIDRVEAAAGFEYPNGSSTVAPATKEIHAMSTATTTPSKSFFAKALSAVGKFFAGFFTDLLGSDGATVEKGIEAFIGTDVGALAVDAVQYASTLPGGTSDDALRSAAVAKLKADLVTAGKDAAALAESTLNLFIEMAFTYVQGTVAKLPAAIG